MFAAKGVHFDSSVPHMHSEGKTVFQIYHLGGHYTFMNAHSHIAAISKQGTTYQVHVANKKSRTALEWHSIMAHPSHDTVMQLEKSSSNVVISDISLSQVPKTNECETCALTKSHHIISRSSEKSEISEALFHRVTFDLMQFNTALNGDQWCSHLACSTTDFNLIYTHRHKSDA